MENSGIKELSSNALLLLLGLHHILRQPLIHVHLLLLEDAGGVDSTLSSKTAPGYSGMTEHSPNQSGDPSGSIAFRPHAGGLSISMSCSHLWMIPYTRNDGQSIFSLCCQFFEKLLLLYVLSPRSICGVTQQNSTVVLSEFVTPRMLLCSKSASD